MEKQDFFALVKNYNEDPGNFSIQYIKNNTTRKISKDIEDNIIKELKIEKKLIAVPEI